MLSTLLNKIQYSPNGTTTQFAFPYLFLVETHLQVTVTETDGTDTLQTLTTDYTVTGEEDPAGGTVTMVTAPASGTILTVARIVPINQLVDYIANDDFPAETHETALDKITMILQQIAEELERSIRFPITENYDGELLDEIGRANTIMVFDSDGVLTYVDYTTFLASLIPTTGAFSMSAPTGSATSKTVTITPSVASYYRCRVWIVDGANLTPVTEVAIPLPDGNPVGEWVDITQGLTGFDVTLTHNGTSSSWKVCVEVQGEILMSSAMVLGV